MKHLAIAFIAVVIAGCSALSDNRASKNGTNVQPDPYDMTYRGGQ